jgi:hypothetical protein
MELQIGESEREVLEDVLARALSELREELYHTDTAAVQSQLRIRKWYLQSILDRVRSPAQVERSNCRADHWLSHQLARQLADLGGALDVEDIWAAADKLDADESALQVQANLVLLGADADSAQRIVERLVAERANGGPPSRPSSNAAERPYS